MLSVSVSVRVLIFIAVTQPNMFYILYSINTLIFLGNIQWHSDLAGKRLFVTVSHQYKHTFKCQYYVPLQEHLLLQNISTALIIMLDFPSISYQLNGYEPYFSTGISSFVLKELVKKIVDHR